MQVHLKTILAGPDHRFAPGVREIPDALAEVLIKAGHAERIEKMVPTETVEVEVEAVAEELQEEKPSEDGAAEEGGRQSRRRRKHSRSVSGQ